jgi:hypothetical protein
MELFDGEYVSSPPGMMPRGGASSASLSDQVKLLVERFDAEAQVLRQTLALPSVPSASFVGCDSRWIGCTSPAHICAGMAIFPSARRPVSGCAAGFAAFVASTCVLGVFFGPELHPANASDASNIAEMIFIDISTFPLWEPK